MGKMKYAWVTRLPAFWIVLTTLYASFQKLLPANGDKIHDTVSHVATEQIWLKKKEEAILANNEALINKANTIIHNIFLDAVLCGFFMIVVFVVLF